MTSYRNILKLVWPLALGMVNNAVMQFVDRAYLAHDSIGALEAVLPAGMPATNWGGSFLVIPEQSKNKEAAWAFVEYMLCTSEAQNTMFKAVDYFPAYEPAWEAAPELYVDGDPYFGGQAPNSIATKIAAEVPAVYNTIMDTTAEGYTITSFDAGYNAGETAEQIRDRLGRDIEAACAELKLQQIQTLKDAGVWKGE